jgi:hypothetical protein
MDRCHGNRGVRRRSVLSTDGARQAEEFHRVTGVARDRYSAFRSRCTPRDSQFFKVSLANRNTLPGASGKRGDMKLIIMSVALVALVAGAGQARAERWDSRGWVKLGERTVNGKIDHDRIDVGRYEGKFSKLTLYVENSDLELLDFEITLGNNERFHPEVRHVFKEGARTRVIDLPGDDRVIKAINLKYKNLPGGGRAKVEVWGWKAEAAGAPGRPAAFSWDSAGWTMLGEREVNGRVDHDRIEVGRHEGKFAKVTLIVLDSDLELLDFEIKFERGAPWHPAVKHVFREGQRTRVIDFPGDERAIKFIDFKYKNLPGGGRAKIQVWAR